ncbi:hypothetical protein BDN67DRAFT_1018161 [Paxillus ammoniavirescens]|nr:hypothetical protein BDN67DRAFT_1018161 [Paxillus ammoniavirescens]
MKGSIYQTIYLLTYILFDYVSCISLREHLRAKLLSHSQARPSIAQRLVLSTTTRPISNYFTSLPGLNLELPSRITYPSFHSFFASSQLITKNLSCSAREKEEICLSASVLTASLKGRTIRALSPSTGLVLVPS